jgi:formylglycine-generating enzyme required for sulfatase activity
VLKRGADEQRSRRATVGYPLGALALAVAPCTSCHAKVDPLASEPSPIDLAMTAIPEGAFQMGSSDGDPDERPAHEVRMPSFRIGRTDVTVAEYGKCEAAGACTKTPAKPYCNEHEAGREAHPINCVTWAQASAFCAWARARLPTEAEWEYAARGGDRRRYPWGGDAPAKQLCWDGRESELGLGKRRSTCAADAHPDGAGPFGTLDLAGNVWQWTSDLYSRDYASPRTGPKRVVRGGTWYSYDPSDVRATLRFQIREDKEDYGVGVRCAR